MYLSNLTSFSQNVLGLKKGAKLVNMLFHWRGILTILTLSLAAMARYVKTSLRMKVFFFLIILKYVRPFVLVTWNI